MNGPGLNLNQQQMKLQQLNHIVMDCIFPKIRVLFIQQQMEYYLQTIQIYQGIKMQQESINSRGYVLDKAPRSYRRNRKGKDYTIASLKIILRVLLDIIRNRPLRVKQIAGQIATKLAIFNPGKQIELKTIQKRTYDAILVLRAMNLLTLQNKKVLVEQNQYLVLFRLYQKISSSKEEASKQQVLVKSIQAKKRMVEKLKKIRDTLKLHYYKMQKSRNKTKKLKSNEKIQMQNAIGLIVDKHYLNQNMELSIQRSEIIVRNPKLVLSNVELIECLRK